MDELTSQSATRLAELIRTRVVSPVEVLEAHLRRIERMNPALNAIVTLAPDALAQARAAEGKVMSNDELGVLHGVPVTIKDTIETAGLRSTSGSKIREHCIPEKDAPVVARLKAAGAIIIGKTNTPELAIPYETDNPIFGRTNNPYDLSRTPGGSSGGEAAAIAACLSPAGIGSDLSGSIRVPAHFCGIAGLKPTTGQVPMLGHMPTATGQFALGASIGPMARCVQDLRLLFNVIAVAGSSREKQLSAGDVDSGADADAGDLLGWHICWFRDDGVTPVTAETSQAIKTVAAALSAAGAAMFEFVPPGVAAGSQLWVDLFAQASLDQLREFYRERESQAGPVVRSLLEAATTNPGSAERMAVANAERQRRRSELLEWMKETPLIIAPVGSTTAFTHGMRRLEVEGQSVSVFRAFSYSQAFNAFDLPVVVVPVGRSVDGLPIGVQIIGRPNEEYVALKVAAIIERNLGGWQAPSGWE